MHKKSITIALSSVLLLSGCQASDNTDSTSEPVETPVSTPTATPEETYAQKAADYLSTMSLEEKVEQMLMPAIQQYDGTNFTEMNEEVENILSQYHFGGIILFASNMTSDSSATVELTQSMQIATTSGGGAPLLIGTDQEGGIVYRLTSGTTTTSQMALAASGDTNNAKKTGEIIGAELKALGINLDFAPDLDVNSNPANPIIGTRSYSDNPETVSTYSAAYMEGLQDNNIIATGKHFPGHGDTSTDSHTGLPLVDKSREDLENNDLIPFREAVENGVDMIMSAHIQYPQVESTTYTSIKDGAEIYLPSTLSHTMITEILREELGFNGVITTDSLQMDAIAENFSTQDSAKLAINAGVDILLMPFEISSSDTSEIDSYIQGIVDMVNDGEIEEDTIDAAVTRILTLKYKRGIMDATYSDDNTKEMIQEAGNVVGCDEHLETNREVAEKTVTVLKNDNDLLPFKITSAKHVIAIAKDEDQMYALDYGFSRLKEEGVIDEDADIFVTDDNYGSNTSYAINCIEKSADLVIICSLMTTADQINYSDSALISSSAQEIDVAKSLGIPVVAISTNLPYDTPLLQDADAIVCIYDYVGIPNANSADSSPTETYSEALPAADDVIFGKCGTSATLPVDVPDISNGQFTSNILYSRGTGITIQ